MQVLRIGSKGPQVEQWQTFLIGSGVADGLMVDGDFGPSTDNATRAFQKLKGLTPDGVVGRETLSKAIADGFGELTDSVDNVHGPEWPPPPNFAPLVSAQSKANLFGAFKYESDPTPGNPEAIRITDGWDQRNIVPVHIPQLKKVKGAPYDCNIYFHKAAVPQLLLLWDTWEQEGLLPLVKTWAGSYVARFVRGSKVYLSNHAYGTAFDINVAWNQLGAEPALVGSPGSVRQLVQSANDCGFYWGGHFGRRDGQHFEVAILK